MARNKLNMIRLGMVLLVLALPSVPLRAEKILMKNGDTLTGSLIRFTVEYALFSSYLGTVRIPRKYISEIQNSKGKNEKVQVRFNDGTVRELRFLDSNGEFLIFQKEEPEEEEEPIRVPWEDISDCIFLENQ